MNHLVRVPTTWALLSFFVCIAAPAQGQSRTRASWAKVDRDNLRIQWSGDGKWLWYVVEDRLENGDGQRKYYKVRLAGGEKSRLFEPRQLADSLGALLKEPVGVQQLESLSDVRLVEDGEGFEFEFAGRRYQCLGDHQLQPIDGSNTTPGDLLTQATVSRGGGDESSLSIINQLEQPITCWWLSPQGAAVEYLTIEPQASHSQHTFAQHVWSLRDAEGKELVRLMASEGDREVCVGPGLVAAFDMLPAPTPRANHRRDGAGPPADGPAYIEQDNLWLRQADAEPYQLTHDGHEKNRYRGPLRVSPSGRYLAAIRERIVEKRKVTLVESSPAEGQPVLRTFDYPKPGDELDQPQVCLFDLETRQAIEVPHALMSNPWSLRLLDWTGQPERLLCLYNQRGHQTMRVLAIEPDAASEEAKVTAIVDEVSETFIDYSQKTFVELIQGNTQLLWASERSGFNHLFRYDLGTGELLNQLTAGQWVMRGVERVDAEKQQVWFAASGLVAGEDPYYRHLCRVDFNGENFVRLTEGDGEHSWEFSPDGESFIDRYSRVDLPPVVNVRSAEEGRRICELEQADWSALVASGWSPPQRFVAKGRDGRTDIYGIIVRPANFDPAKKYPIVEKIYAGPHSAHVPKAFNLLRQEHEMADLGFVIVMIDGMGTSHRGKAFHDVCWKNLADAGFPDRIEWIRAAAAEHPEMDLNRVGIFGGSAGGQNAMRALLDHHDFYRVAVADCGCHDNRMDKIWWNEAWMGWPVDASYEQSSNVVHADRLQGNLLLIVGELDSNVDPASTLQVVDALIKADKDFELLIVPGAGHGAAETPYGARRRAEFLVRHLLDKP